MSKDYEIIKKLVPVTMVYEDGNFYTDKYNCECCLKNEKGLLSQEYQCILDLGDDHFAVCKVFSRVNYLRDGTADERYYGIVGNEYEITDVGLKWGVIRVNRNEKGEIIPGCETLVVPYVYDRISSNNEKTATVYNNGKLTYLDIDVNSKSYGKQLAPCYFDHAVPFSTQIEGFAECSLEETTGYLPRNCKPKEMLYGSELLKYKQAQTISRYLNGKIDDSILDFETKDAYFNLTGERLQKENVKTLVKRKNR